MHGVVRTTLVVLIAASTAGCLDLSPDGKVFATGGGTGTASGGGVGAGGGGASASAGGGTIVGGSGGGSVTGGSTGQSTGGGSASGGGSAPRPFTYETLTLPSGVTGELRDVSGGDGVWYAIAGSTRLIRRVGTGAVELVTPFASNESISAVWLAPDGAVFVAGIRSFGVCRTECHLGTSYTFTQRNDDDAYALCGLSSSAVYAVVQRTLTQGALVKWNGSTWSDAVTFSMQEPRACTLQVDGSMLVMGRGGVLRFQAGGLTPESFEPAPLSSTELSNVAFGNALSSSVETVVLGAEHKHFRRGADGTWRAAFIDAPAYSTVELDVVALGFDVFLGGSGNGTVRLLRWANGQATPVTPAPPDVRIRRMAVVGVNQIVMVGSDGAAGPRVVTATR